MQMCGNTHAKEIKNAEDNNFIIIILSILLKINYTVRIKI